jgi:hypothetical protein
MNRCLAFIGALLFSLISVASACTASPGQWVHFTLEPEHGSDQIQASFRSGDRPNHNNNNWSTDFRPTDLVGLDVAGFRGSGSRPLGFALIREAGRLDCSGQGGQSYAAGSCGFTADPGFARLLEGHGIARPTDEQAFAMMSTNVRRELIDAIGAAHYPTPRIDDLIALAALDVNGAYIADMARAGYRPRTMDGLIQFKALDITPQWIAGFVRSGYADLPADQLVQMKALDITICRSTSWSN